MCAEVNPRRSEHLEFHFNEPSLMEKLEKKKEKQMQKNKKKIR